MSDPTPAIVEGQYRYRNYLTLLFGTLFLVMGVAWLWFAVFVLGPEWMGRQDKLPSLGQFVFSVATPFVAILALLLSRRSLQAFWRNDVATIRVCPAGIQRGRHWEHWDDIA